MKKLSCYSIRAVIIILPLFVVFCSTSDDAVDQSSTPTPTASPTPTIITFLKTFGGENNERALSVCQTRDNGYIFCGRIVSYQSSYNAYVVKTDEYGDTVWSGSYGGSSAEFGEVIQETTDGGYIICGTTYSTDDSQGDIFATRLDSEGAIIWSFQYGRSNYAGGMDICQTADQGFIVCGQTAVEGSSNDIIVIKIDRNGHLEWLQTYGGPLLEQCYSVMQSVDNCSIIVGSTMSYGNGSADVYLLKIDPDGNELWSRTFGGDAWDAGAEVRQVSDGGYIVCGRTYSFGAGSADLFLIKTDDQGHEEWSRTYGGHSIDEGHSVKETADGGYILCGTIISYSNTAEVWLLETDRSGQESWSRTFGLLNWSEGLSVEQTTDGGYILGGYAFPSNYYSDALLIKTDQEGNI